MSSSTNTTTQQQKPAVQQHICIVGRTFFYNKTQDAASSKAMLDIRSRQEYDLTHVRASYSTPITNDHHQLEDELLLLNNIGGGRLNTTSDSNFPENVVPLSIRELLHQVLINSASSSSEPLEQLEQPQNNNDNSSSSSQPPPSETTTTISTTKKSITNILNQLYGKVYGFKLRGIGYKSVLLYGDEDISFTELKSGLQKVGGNETKFPNCDKLVETASRIVGDVHLEDVKRYPVLLLAELLKREGEIENIFVLDSYKSYLAKYHYVVTHKDRLGHQTLYPTEIIENFLFLGNRDNASSDRELTDIGITYILNMAEEVDNVLEEKMLESGEKKYKYLKLGTGDTIEHSISNLFEQANEFLKEAFDNNCKAIVNCNMGISRSSTTVLSYLMKYYSLSFDEAFHHSKGHRSIVCPNLAFREQLKTFYSKKEE